MTKRNGLVCKAHIYLFSLSLHLHSPVRPISAPVGFKIHKLISLFSLLLLLSPKSVTLGAPTRPSLTHIQGAPDPTLGTTDFCLYFRRRC